jgi:predicted membrane protein
MSKKETVFYIIVFSLILWSLDNIIKNIPQFVWWLLFAAGILMVFAGTGLFVRLIENIKSFLNCLYARLKK